MNAVGWFEIYVQDMVKAKTFYEGVFQQTLETLNAPMPNMEMLSFPGNQDDYGALGAIVKMPGVESGGNTVLVYFSCDDCAVEEARVQEFGGEVVHSKFSIKEHGFISMVKDPDGNMIGLHSMT